MPDRDAAPAAAEGADTIHCIACLDDGWRRVRCPEGRRACPVTHYDRCPYCNRDGHIPPPEGTERELDTGNRVLAGAGGQPAAGGDLGEMNARTVTLTGYDGSMLLQMARLVLEPAHRTVPKALAEAERRIAIRREIEAEFMAEIAQKASEWIGLAMLSTTPEGHYVMDRERFGALIGWLHEGAARPAPAAAPRAGGEHRCVGCRSGLCEIPDARLCDDCQQGQSREAARGEGEATP